MGSPSRTLATLAFATSIVTGAGHAAAQDKLCVSSAYGVPGTDGKPQPWWSGTFDIDDPRWTGASGHSLASIGASHSPVEVRTTWANEGGRDYLYASWIINVNTTESGAHWLYLAFMPPTATIDSPATRLVRVRFNAGAAVTDVPAYCETEASCTSQPAIYQVFERVIEPGTPPDPDVPVNAACGDTATVGIISGPKFQIVPAATGALPWLTDSLRFKNEAGTNRWAVQLRVPVDPAAASLGTGVREDTAIAFQTGLELIAGAVAFHRWPRTVPATPVQLICELVGSSLDPDALVVDPASTWIPLRTIGGGAVADPPPVECGKRLRIDSGDIGIRPGAAGTALTSDFSTSAANSVVARVHNTSGATIAASALTARFRIANWGVQIAVDGSWDPLPVTDPTAHNTTAINDSDEQDLALTWDLTDDQACQYTYDQRTGSAAEQASWNAACVACTVGVSGGDGARARLSAPTVCLAKRRQHQCMLVELGGGDVDYESRSTYRNMDFAPLSVFERKATIDTAGLPSGPGQKSHEIYLVVMPRNMPGAIQAQTYEQMIAERAAALLAALQAPEAHEHVVPEDPRFGSLRERELVRPLPQRLELPEVPDEDIRRFPVQVRPLARELSRLALLGQRRSGVKSAELVSVIADSFDSATLADLVPTLDVYAYYRTSPTGRALAPMTAFSLVTSHDGAIDGLRWALDGATRVHGNVYKLVIGNDKSAEIGVRVQALEAGESPISERPCGGCCRPACESSIGAQLGNAPIGLAVLVLAVGGLRRRRKRR